MNIRLVFLSGLLVAAVFAARLSMSVQAAPAHQQQNASPTPGADGRIMYTAKAGDTCLLLQALYGVSVDYIRTMNHLDVNCTLQVGQQYFLGIGSSSAASPTPGPSPTPSLIPQTPTPAVGGTLEVCVLLYDDINGDGQRESNEGPIAGGALSLTSLTGAYSQGLITSIPSDPTAYQGTCFTNVPVGKYTVSAAVPAGYNPTTTLTVTLPDTSAGFTSYINFGAQEKTVTTSQTSAGGHSPILGILGVLFLLGGIGLGVYTWRILRK